MGAALLAACGSSGSSGGTTTSAPANLLTQPVETTQQAKRGGVMKDRAAADPPSLDPVAASAPLNTIMGRSYSALVRAKPGVLKPAQGGEFVPDLIEAWETAPDGLQITMHLRQGVKLHNKPPVNGRAFDMDDVMFSWDRFARKSQGRLGVVNSVNPDAPVLSFAATDSKTIVVKLKEPIVYALGLLTTDFNPTGSFTIFPKEADSSLNVQNDVIGTGAFVMTKYEPSVGFTFKRNPEFWDKDYALVDTVEFPIVSEPAAALAQFKAGNIYYFAPKPEDLLIIKGDEPRILIFQGDLGANGGSKLNFGWTGKSSYFDERVRQAVSMSWDRDLFIETFFNVAKFASQGIAVETRWNTATAMDREGWWLDPKGKDFGPNAKYYMHDVAEAKKLLAAAGYPSGLDVTSNYPTGPELDVARFARVVDSMANDAGFKTKENSLDYQKEYIPLRNSHGQFEGGWLFAVANEPNGGETAAILSNEYWSKGGNAFHGFSANGKNDQAGDPQVDAILTKARVEQDTEKRRALVFEAQRYLAKAAYSLSLPGGGSTFTMAWPCLGNFRVYLGQGARANYRNWIDETKAPFKSA